MAESDLHGKAIIPYDRQPFQNYSGFRLLTKLSA